MGGGGDGHQVGRMGSNHILRGTISCKKVFGLHLEYEKPEEGIRQRMICFINCCEIISGTFILVHSF